MSRVSLIEQLYVKRKSALEFNYDALWAPPIRSIFTQEDINELYRIATSLRYNGNIEKKYKLIDNVMRSRGFRRTHCGTNRVVYSFLELPTFVAKVAIDKVGMKDSPAEFKNQEYFKPFCCKIFEVDPSGVIAFVERVNPITSLEEFLSVSDDVFNMMITKIVGKYIVDDLGTEKFMNYGLRQSANGHTFGPVIIDFPYAYELDGAKLICQRPIETPMGEIPCGGEIDYDTGFNHLVCTKCGKRYEALDLKKNDKNILIMYGYENKGDLINMRAQIVSNGKVIADSGLSSKTHITREQYESIPVMNINDKHETRPVKKNTRQKYKRLREYSKEHYTSLQIEQYNKMQTERMRDKSKKTKVIADKKSEHISIANVSFNTANNNYTTRRVISNINNSPEVDKSYTPYEESSEIKVIENLNAEEIIDMDVVISNEEIEPEYGTIEVIENIDAEENVSEQNLMYEESKFDDAYEQETSDDQIEVSEDTNDESSNDEESKNLNQSEQKIIIAEESATNNDDVYLSIMHDINTNTPEYCILGDEDMSNYNSVYKKPKLGEGYGEEMEYDGPEYKSRNRMKYQKKRDSKKRRKNTNKNFNDYSDGMDDF